MKTIHAVFVVFTILLLMGMTIVWKWHKFPSQQRIQAAASLQTQSQEPEVSPAQPSEQIRIHWLMSEPNALIGEAQNLTSAPIARLRLKAPQDEVGYTPSTTVGPYASYDGTAPLQPAQWGKFVISCKLTSPLTVYSISVTGDPATIRELSYYEDNDRFHTVYQSHH